jgi:hypothetical protein
MIVKPEDDQDNYRDHDDWRDHDNDNERAIAPAPARGALTSLAALEVALNKVDTASVVGWSGKPMLQFKRDGDGTWTFGQRRTVPESDSQWAVNPTTFKWGFVAFNDNNKPSERLVPSASRNLKSRRFQT